jgi:hypothetical protein
MYSKVCIGKHLTHNLPIQNGLKQEGDFLALHFSFAVEYAIRKVEKYHVGLKLKWDTLTTGLCC